ncbi:MAG: cobalamin B12-binding domain-containing protein [Gemmatimonadales bacterium]|nr:cobalamin B12-binding domain-containing protein [Gemmatimonadales bacterium]
MTAPDPTATLSIGALAAATGIPADTLRTWERRYGYPTARRKPSGHRVYPFEMVERLRRIADLIARGHRAGEVVNASDKALGHLGDAGVATRKRPTPPSASGPAALDDLLRAAADFDTTTLRRSFEFDWAHRGPIDFLEERAAPFLRAIGRAWETGDLDIRHEHVASACLGDFLRSVRAPHDATAHGPVVVLATLSGERHGLGLQMCATVFALAGWRSVLAGVDTPPDEVAKLAAETGARAVAISVVQPSGKPVVRAVASLRRSLPARIALLVGGSGIDAESAMVGLQVIPDLRALDRWVRGRRG